MDDVNQTFKNLNDTIPGKMAIPFLGSFTGAGPAGANAVGAQTLMQAAANQGANLLANAAGANPPPINWAGAFRGAALSYVAVQASFEIGLYTGSFLSTIITNASFGPPSSSGRCSCKSGK